MKQIKEQKQELIAIRVTTLPNGYSVDLEKENFMYYSPMALLERDEATGGGERVEGHHR